MIERIKATYISASLPMKATIWFAVCQFLQKGISMLTTPIFTRLLSTEEYGLTSAFISWENILLILLNLSLAKVILNLCSKYDDGDLILNSIIKLNYLVFGLFTFLIIIFWPTFLDITKIGKELSICLLICTFCQSLMSCWTVRCQYSYQYKRVVIMSLIYSVCTAFGGVLNILIFDNCALSKILAQTIILIIIGLMVTIFYIVFKRYKTDIRIWKYALNFCIPLLPHFLSEIVLSSSDRIMINNMCGSTDTAIYSIAYSVGNIIAMITGAINGAFAPYQYQKIKTKEYKALAKNTNLIIAFVAICLVVIMLFGREIVLLFGGRKYVDSISIIIPISLGVFFNYVFQLFARVQEYYTQKHMIVIASISCALLNIITNYIFINVFGYKAAAYTTFACYLIFCWIHYLFYKLTCKKFIGKDIYDVKTLLVISALLIGMSLLCSLLSKFLIIKIVLVLGGLAIVYCKREEIKRMFVQIVKI